MLRRDHILITGFPGSGKTTLFRRLVDELQHLNPAGFYTAEIREGKSRRGFELCSLDGRTGTLAHVDLRTGYRVGKYVVDVNGFEAFLAELPLWAPQTGLVMIDEIGKMECLSDRFIEIIKSVFDSDRRLVATIAKKGGGLIAQLKKRTDVRLFVLTRENQDKIFIKVRSFLQEPD
ncbi:MAG: AAA family ATPase [Deltaproteobacteria bacterium]|jgi:nucleoside-triphosphatase|nr:AAA family ATPase [Deltaproteobacteria bacterium]